MAEERPSRSVKAAQIVTALSVAGQVALQLGDYRNRPLANILWVLIGLSIFFIVVQAVRQRVGFRWPIYNKSKLTTRDQAEPNRLAQLEAEDRSDLRSRVFARYIDADRSRLQMRPSPYVDLRFSVFNGSVFRVAFGRDVDGHVVCMDQRLEKIPQIEDPTAMIPRGERIPMTLRVWLTKEEAEFIEAGPRPNTWPSAWFSLEHVGIWIIALDVNDQEAARSRLDLSWTTFYTGWPGRLHFVGRVYVDGSVVAESNPMDLASSAAFIAEHSAKAKGRGVVTADIQETTSP